MFKTGQLVFNSINGKYWIISKPMIYGYFELLYPTNPSFDIAHHRQLTLIGNNYRSKK